VVPAEIVARAVPVPSDALSQTENLVDQILVGERLEFIVGRHHAESVRGTAALSLAKGQQARSTMTGK